MTAFLRLWTWFSLRHLRRHLWRSAAVLIGIGLGAAVFTSVRLATNASVGSFARSVDTVTGKAEWTVVSPGGRVPEGLVAGLARLPAVRAASPLLMSYVLVPGDEAEPLLLIGLDPIGDRSVRTWKTAAESGPDNPRLSLWQDLMGSPYTLVAATKFLERRHLVPGDTITLQHITRSADFRVAGALSREGLALLEGGNAAITDIATFQELTGTCGAVDRIDLLLAHPGSEKDVEAVRSALGGGASLERPSESRESGQAMIRSYQLNLSILSFVSLFVGMFLVYSMISLHATARRGELAILLSLGASARTLFWIFVAEGAFLGIAGWVLAIPLSLFLTEKLLVLVSSTISHLFVRVHVEGVGLEFGEALLSFAVTLLVSITAACQPAWEASRVRPLEAMTIGEAGGASHGPKSWPAVSGLVLIGSVWPLSNLPGIAGVPVPGYLATFFLFLGFALLSPLLLRAAGSKLPAVLGRIGGQPAFLGARYMRDAGTRAAISVGALITAIALFAGLVIMVHSFRTTVAEWVSQGIRGDLYLRPRMADMNRYRDPLPDELIGGLQALGDQVDLLPYRRIFLNYGPVSYVFEPIDVGAFLKHARFFFMDGDIEAIGPRLVRGEGVVVSEVFSNRTGLRTGDRYRVRVEGLDLDLPILGIIRDYRTQGGVVHYSLSHYERLTGSRFWTGVAMYFKTPRDDPERDAVRLKAEILSKTPVEPHGIEITVGGDLRRAILRIFDETFAITFVLLFISLVVAALGIATTLTILVLERSRQFHTMVAGGASRGQVRAMICWEAVLMVVLGEVIGVACGFVLSHLLIFVINKQSFGWTFLYSVDWAALALSFPLVCATALLASLPAAQLVFRLSPATVLREN